MLDHGLVELFFEDGKGPCSMGEEDRACITGGI